MHAPDLAQTKVLVVDDEPIVARSIARILRPAHVRTVSSASEALDVILREGPFDAVLCDLVMAPIDGGRFKDLLADVSPDHVPRLAFVTGCTDREWVERRFPSVTVLYKPFAAADVRDLVGTITTRS